MCVASAPPFPHRVHHGRVLQNLVVVNPGLFLERVKDTQGHHTAYCVVPRPQSRDEALEPISLIDTGEVNDFIFCPLGVDLAQVAGATRDRAKFLSFWPHVQITTFEASALGIGPPPDTAFRDTKPIIFMIRGESLTAHITVLCVLRHDCSLSLIVLRTRVISERPPIELEVFVGFVFGQ